MQEMLFEIFFCFQLRQEYAAFFQEHAHVDRLMYNVFRLMPDKAAKMFNRPYQFDVTCKQKMTNKIPIHTAVKDTVNLYVLGELFCSVPVQPSIL